MADFGFLDVSRYETPPGGKAFPVASATPNTKGPYTEIVAATAFDTGILILHAGATNFPAATVGGQILIDLAVGAAGSEQVFAADVMFESSEESTEFIQLIFPVSIPVGSRLAVRIQSDDASAGMGIQLALGGVAYAGLPKLGAVDTYGADTGDSGGTQVDPGATPNTKGAYSQITASTNRPIRWLIFLLGGKGNETPTDAEWLYDVAIGAGGSEQIIFADLFTRAQGTADQFQPLCMHFPFSIPSGTRLAVRSECSTAQATDRLMDVELIGVA